MKKRSTYCVVGILSLILGGCITTGKFVQPVPFGPIPGIESGEIITGEGVSNIEMTSAARDSAYADAYSKLVQNIKVHVEGATTRILKGLADATRPEFGDLAAGEKAKSLAEIVVDADLKEYRRLVREARNEKTGEYWVQIIVPISAIDKWTKQRLVQEKEIRRIIVEDQLEKVKKELNDEIEKDRQRQEELENKIKQEIQKNQTQ